MLAHSGTAGIAREQELASAEAIGERAGPLTEALRTARIREATHVGAVTALTDAKLLRLQILKDELASIVAASPAARESFDLAISPGEPPHLWIDLITSVVMEPDPKTYRLIEDTQMGRVVLLESGNRAEVIEQVKLQMAHQIIARERRRALGGRVWGSLGKYSQASLLLAWLTGFAFGAMCLMAAVIYLKILNI